MLRVTVELLPFGEADGRELAQMEIVNIGGDREYGHYEYVVQSDAFGAAPAARHTGHIDNHLRQQSVWRLEEFESNGRSTRSRTRLRLGLQLAFHPDDSTNAHISTLVAGVQEIVRTLVRIELPKPAMRQVVH